MHSFVLFVRFVAFILLICVLLNCTTTGEAKTVTNLKLLGDENALGGGDSVATPSTTLQPSVLGETTPSDNAADNIKIPGSETITAGAIADEANQQTGEPQQQQQQQQQQQPTPEDIRQLHDAHVSSELLAADKSSTEQTSIGKTGTPPPPPPSTTPVQSHGSSNIQDMDFVDFVHNDDELQKSIGPKARYLHHEPSRFVNEDGVEVISGYSNVVYM